MADAAEKAARERMLAEYGGGIDPHEQRRRDLHTRIYVTNTVVRSGRRLAVVAGRDHDEPPPPPWRRPEGV